MSNAKQTTKHSSQTKKTLSMLLLGKGKIAKKFAGKHVMVVKNKVLPMKKGEAFWNDFEKLKKEYGESPVSLFVPRPDISYILILCR